MGKTVPTYRTQLDTEIRGLLPFRRALRQGERPLFDRLMDHARSHASEGSFTAHPDPMVPFFLSILIEQERSIRDLHRKLDGLMPGGGEGAPRSVTCGEGGEGCDAREPGVRDRDGAEEGRGGARSGDGTRGRANGLGNPPFRGPGGKNTDECDPAHGAGNHTGAMAVTGGGTGDGTGAGTGTDIGDGVGRETGTDIGDGVGRETGTDIGDGAGRETGTDIGDGAGRETGNTVTDTAGTDTAGTGTEGIPHRRVIR